MSGGNAGMMADFIEGLPKAELHIHIEGSLEPEMMFEFAARNGVRLPYASAAEARLACRFTCLQDFLDIYYRATQTLRKEQDFFDLTLAYLQKASRQNVLHAEIFFDPQSHTGRGVSFASVIGGINRAQAEAKARLGVSSKLIMCFLRHLDEASAMAALDMALEYKELIIAVGLDSSELGHPPQKFKEVFKRARDNGFLAVAHAGEEGPPSYVRQALDILGAARVDHGNRLLDDQELVSRLASSQTPLTMCPLSNLKLRVIGDMKDHPLKRLMEKGLMVTVNSDDPAYFGGYVNENYQAVQAALGLTEDQLRTLAYNSFVASFLSPSEKEKMIRRLDEYMAGCNF